MSTVEHGPVSPGGVEAPIRRETGESSAIPSSTRFEVVRSRLDEPIEKLARGECSAIAVWAAAGAGKSVLIARWARLLHQRGESVYWAKGATLSGVLARARRDDKPVVVFVDDAHVLSSAPAKAALVSILDDDSGQVRVVVAGRYQPVSGLAFLQASGRLLELRTEDLAFDGGEVVALAAQQDVQLSDGAAEVLAQRTAGWATAVALAMPWLARSADTGAAVSEFDGNESAIADFLISEVLAGLDPGARRALAAVAVSARVPIELAVLLGDRADITEALHGVAVTNALFSEDPAGFRFHPVLLAFLQAEARRVSAEQASRAHVIAAEWYASHERADEAVLQAIESGDVAVLTDMLSRFGLDLALAGRSKLIATALGRFSSEGGEPLVALVLRLLLDAPTFVDPRRARHLLSLADKVAMAEPTTTDGWAVALDAVRCFIEARDGRSFAGASRLADAVAAKERGASLGLDLLCALAEGWLLARIGDSEKAHLVLRDVRVSAHRAGYDWLFLVASEMSIGILNDLGRWDEAVVLEDRLAEAAERFTTATRDRALRRVEVVAATRRYLRCTDGRDGGLSELVASDPLGLDPELSATARMIVLLAALDVEQNPRRTLDEAERLMRETAVYVPRTLALAAPRLVAVRLGLDGRARAKETAELVYSVLGPDSLESVIVRYILNAPLRSTEPAARQLDDAKGGNRAWHPASFVTAVLLLARLAENTGRGSDADALTQRAVALAVRYRVDRPFLATSSDGIGLVASRLGRFGHLEEDARRIVALAPRQAAERQPDQLVIDSLTPKERDILLELPVHQSVAEIARRHTLSVNTVKTHLRNIYQKLGVSDRSEAVSMSQRLGLI